MLVTDDLIKRILRSYPWKNY